MKGLKGITVLDFSKLLPGPFATMLLADLGCRVIRVELPHWPDMLRGIGPEIGGHGFAFWMANRNKESLCLDFRKPEGYQTLLRLIAKADAVVEGFRPGMMDRLGLGAKAMLRRFPRLIYCSITGFGTNGPMSARAGHDINFLGESGVLGAGDSNGALSFGPIQTADLAGSHSAAVAVLGALLDRVVSGKGRRIEVSMSEAAFSWLLLPVGLALASGGAYDKDAGHWWSGAKAFYRLYRTKDGRFLVVAALERPFAEALLRALGRDDLLAALDGPNQDSLVGELETLFAGETLEHWMGKLGHKDVCVSAARTVAEALRLAETPPGPGIPPLLSRRRGLPTVRSPIRLSPEGWTLRRLPRALGKDNEAVLRSFGLSKEEVRGLKARGLLKRQNSKRL